MYQIIVSVLPASGGFLYTKPGPLPAPTLTLQPALPLRHRLLLTTGLAVELFSLFMFSESIPDHPSRSERKVLFRVLLLHCIRVRINWRSSWIGALYASDHFDLIAKSPNASSRFNSRARYCGMLTAAGDGGNSVVHKRRAIVTACRNMLVRTSSQFSNNQRTSSQDSAPSSVTRVRAAQQQRRKLRHNYRWQLSCVTPVEMFTVSYVNGMVWRSNLSTSISRCTSTPLAYKRL